MSLPTMSNLPIASPLVHGPSRGASTRPVEEQSQATCEKVCMLAITNWCHLHVRGIGAEAVIAEALNVPQVTIGAVQSVSDEILIRLRRDEFVLLTTDLKMALERLGAKPATSLVTTTDITHGRAVICLCGPQAASVLPKLCALDFASTKFPDRSAAQTSLAKVRALIIRMDAGPLLAYYLVVDRSLADYVWEVVYDAGQEWDAIVLSQDSLEHLRK